MSLSHYLSAIIIGSLVFIFATPLLAQGDPTTNPNVVLVPLPLAYPAFNTPVVDPVFGTTLRRITDATAGNSFGTHIYSQLQAFSADNTYVLLIENDAYIIRSLPDLTVLTLDTSSWNAPRWHPQQADTIVHFDSNGDTTLRLQFTNVSTGLTTTEFTFPAPYERIRSNQSFDEIAHDGSWLAGMASLSNGNQRIFAYNLNTQSLGAQFTLSQLYASDCAPDPEWGELEPDWVGVSPLGNYLIVQWVRDGTERCSGLETFNLTTGAFVGRVYDGHQHGDLGIDSNGTTEFFMTFELYHPSGNLSLGIRTLPGTATVSEPEYIQVMDWHGSHISCQGLPGVCLVTTSDNDNGSWTSLEAEVFLQYTDGRVKRLAHHRSTSCGYWVQPRASLSRDGQYAIFASDWGVDSCAGGNDLGEGEAYLIELPPANNDALALFDPATQNTGIYDSVLNNPNETAYVNTPPSINNPRWVMGDWDGDGAKTPGVFNSGAFRYTNDIGATNNWSNGFWLGNPPSLVGVVSGRFATGFANDNGNDCIGWVDSNIKPNGDSRFSLKYWCDMMTTPQSIGGILSAHWLAAPLSNSQGFSGTFQFAYADWDNDGLDEPGIRRGNRIVRSDNAPSEGAALYGTGTAQRWDTADGDGPGAHGLDDGIFVAGDWNGDGTDTWGVVYDDNTFYYRDVFGFNPGPFEFGSQTFTSSISAPRQVDSHHNARGGSSSPAPAFADGLVANEAINPTSVDTGRNIEADLSISKAGNYQIGEVGLVGDSIVWTIIVSNTGTAPANGVQIIDNVPSELRVNDALADDGSISVRGQTVTFTAESIGVGETVQFQVVTAILSQPSSGTFANSVNVVIPDGDGSGSDAHLVASGTVSSVDALPATGYAKRLRW